MDNPSSRKVNARQLGRGGTAAHPSPGGLLPARQRPGLPTATEAIPVLAALLLAFWQLVLCTSEIHHSSGIYVFSIHPLLGIKF